MNLIKIATKRLHRKEFLRNKKKDNNRNTIIILLIKTSFFTKKNCSYIVLLRIFMHNIQEKLFQSFSLKSFCLKQHSLDFQ